VKLEDLEPASLPGEQTVLIRVDPATPYKEVVSVMEHLHDLGFLIHFQSGN
jgi:biopolymer transport protein ExbD